MAFSFSHRSRILQQAWPIIVANASVPLLGLVDTAVIGQSKQVMDIGALAISNLIFNFVYWAFGFFRMSTTGFIAQARGANDKAEANAVFIRSMSIALICGFLLIALQVLIAMGAFTLITASAEVETIAKQYFAIRIWGAPATLGLYCIMGVCIGYGKTKLLLLIQLGMNFTNIILDIVFASIFQFGVVGIAMGTLIAEWGTLMIAGIALYRLVFWPDTVFRDFKIRRYFERKKIKALFLVNTDIFIRTLFLLLGFAWFTDASAQHGDVQLAANHILLMFISFSAFFLDGFAFVAEEKVGAAMGRNDWPSARKSIYLTSEIGFITALVLSGLVFLFGTYGISFITGSIVVNEQVQSFLPWACVYILLSIAAFQLDGVFIGATLSGPMRNASLLSFFIFISSEALLTQILGHSGLWLSFIIFVVARALCLAFYWPQLVKRFTL